MALPPYIGQAESISEVVYEKKFGNAAKKNPKRNHREEELFLFIQCAMFLNDVFGGLPTNQKNDIYIYYIYFTPFLANGSLPRMAPTED